MYGAALKLIKLAWPYLAACAVGFGAAYYWQGLRWDAEVATLKQEWADERRALANAANDELQRQIKVIEGQARQISLLDQKYTQELNDAQTEIDRLVGDVRSGERRLYVDADCSGGDRVPGNSASTGLDHGAGKARLNADTAERLIRITERGDRAIRQLGACQEYVRTIQNQRGTEDDN